MSRRFNIQQLPTGSYDISGSFSGSFQGDGSDLTNVTSSFIPVGLGGIYGGNGTVPLNTTASINGDFTFQGLDEDTRLIVRDGNNGSAIHLFSDGPSGQSGVEFRTQTTDSLLHRIQIAGGDTRYQANQRDLVFSTSTSSLSSGIFITASNGNVGIGTVTPNYKLEVVGTNGVFNTGLETLLVELQLSSQTTSGITQHNVESPNAGSLLMGIRGIDNTSNPGFGEQGDSFIYSSIVNNGLNIISQAGSGTDDYIRFYAGQLATTGNTPDLYIQGSGSTRGYVGIGTTTPNYKLDVNGTTNINGNTTITGSLNVDGSVNLNVMPGLNLTGKLVLGRRDLNNVRFHEIEVNNSMTSSLNSLGFNIHNSATPTSVSRVMTLLGNGNVGIGTITPNYILDVSGSTNIDGNTTITGSLIVTTSVTASSYTGSFVGDGSQLTGIISSKWSGSNPITRDSDVEITGSLNVTGGVTASLFGTASWAENALTASYALTSSFAQSGNGNFSGSFSGSFEGDGSQLTGIISSKWSGSNTITRDSDVEITGSFNVKGQTTLFTTGSGTLTVQGSGSAQPLFLVTGSIGELISVIDQDDPNSPLLIVSGSAGQLFVVENSITGSLLQIYDSSSNSVFEVNNDAEIVYGVSSSILSTQYLTIPVTASYQTIYNIETGSFTGAFVNYTVVSSSNARAGQLMSVWNGGTASYTETTTTDIGDTSQIAFDVIMTGSVAQLSVSSSLTTGWQVKTTLNIL